MNAKLIAPIHIIALLLTLFFLNCQQAKERSRVISKQRLIPKYAKGFSIDYFSDSMVIHTHTQEDSADFVLRQPLNRIVCLSSTHVGALCLLDAREKIVGVSSRNYIYDSLLLSSPLEELGESNQLNFEKLYALKPDLVMLFTIDPASNSIIQKLQRMKIPFIINAEFKEKGPLAQAEWIKLFGALTDRAHAADSLFNLVEVNYMSIKNRCAQISPKPKVLINIPWNGVWYMSGKESIIAQLIADAGGHYLFNELQVNGTIPMSFEGVYSKGKDADYWINTGICKKQSDLLLEDKKLNLFKAYRNRQLYNNVRRMRSSGGNDFWELGVMRPDLVLEDLDLIFTARAPHNFYIRLD